MYLLVIYLPFLSFILISCFGKFISKKGVFLITLLCIGFCFCFTCFFWYEVIFYNSNCFLILYSWISSDFIKINFGFLFDGITICMLFIIFLISFLVNLYSIEYMRFDPHIKRFMAYLSLFTFFMVILVTSDNLVQMFFGWEGVGLVSYLLINFWFTRIEANKAALKAILVNKIGDLCILLAIFFCLFFFKSINYNIIFSIIYLYQNEVIWGFSICSIIGFFIFLGVIGKSAQIGLHTWLPDAMEGPTPVSALIHAATMVTAGVFLLIRCSAIFEYTSELLFFITIIGGLTAFFGASIGLFQNDLKKVIAYSTCSQLGYMIFACGLSNYLVSFFHLINHAFFKALLFLAAGAIIHSIYNEQDMRKYGGLLNILPFIYIVFCIGSLALIGFPFLSGFYSKDIILELIFINYSLNGVYIYWLSLLATCFTAFYSFRLLFITFILKPNGYKNYYKKLHHNSNFIIFVLFILSIFSIFWGYFMKDLFIGLGNNFTNNGIFILPIHYLLYNLEFIFILYKHIPFLFSIFSIILCFYLNFYFFKYNFWISNYKILLYYKFFLKKWYIDIIYNKIFVYYYLKNSLILLKYIDKGLFEYLGFLKLILVCRKLILVLSKLFNGFIVHYFFLLFFIIIFTILYFYIFIFFIQYVFLFFIIFWYLVNV